MIITYHNPIQRSVEKMVHQLRPIVLKLAGSSGDLAHLHGVLKELSDATIPIEQRGKKNSEGQKRNRAQSTHQRKAFPIGKPVVKSKSIKPQKGKNLTTKVSKDSIDVLLDDLLDAEDFDGIRTVLHDMGYAIPTGYPNDLKVPEKWDLMEYIDYCDLFDEEIKPLHLERNAIQPNTEELLILMLEFTIRKRKHPWPEPC